MDSSGAIHELDAETARRIKEDLARGKDSDLVPIPAEELEAVRGMNRKQRRAWHAKKRREQRARRRRKG